MQNFLVKKVLEPAPDKMENPEFYCLKGDFGHQERVSGSGRLIKKIAPIDTCLLKKNRRKSVHSMRSYRQKCISGHTDDRVGVFFKILPYLSYLALNEAIKHKTRF